MRKNTYLKLRLRMYEKGITQKDLADLLGISKQAFSRKITGKGSFKQKDIVAICKCLDIGIDEIGSYFYAI